MTIDLCEVCRKKHRRILPAMDSECAMLRVRTLCKECYGQRFSAMLQAQEAAAERWDREHPAVSPKP